MPGPTRSSFTPTSSSNSLAASSLTQTEKRVAATKPKSFVRHVTCAPVEVMFDNHKIRSRAESRYYNLGAKVFKDAETDAAFNAFIKSVASTWDTGQIWPVANKHFPDVSMSYTTLRAFASVHRASAQTARLHEAEQFKDSAEPHEPEPEVIDAKYLADKPPSKPARRTLRTLYENARPPPKSVEEFLPMARKRLATLPDQEIRNWYGAFVVTLEVDAFTAATSMLRSTPDAPMACCAEVEPGSESDMEIDALAHLPESTFSDDEGEFSLRLVDVDLGTGTPVFERPRPRGRPVRHEPRTRPLEQPSNAATREASSTATSKSTSTETSEAASASGTGAFQTWSVLDATAKNQLNWMFANVPSTWKGGQISAVLRHFGSELHRVTAEDMSGRLARFRKAPGGQGTTWPVPGIPENTNFATLNLKRSRFNRWEVVPSPANEFLI